LGGQGNKLAGFCRELANPTVVAIMNQVGAGTRDRHELPIKTVDTALRLDGMIAQGEFDLEEKDYGFSGNVSRASSSTNVLNGSLMN
jgi:hypothetical protein